MNLSSMTIIPLWEDQEPPVYQRETPWMYNAEIDNQFPASRVVTGSSPPSRTRFLVRLIGRTFHEFRHVYVVANGPISPNDLMAVIVQYVNSVVGHSGWAEFDHDRVPIMLRSMNHDLHVYHSQLLRVDETEFALVSKLAQELGVFPEVCVLMSALYIRGCDPPDTVLIGLDPKDGEEDAGEGNNMEEAETQGQEGGSS